MENFLQKIEAAQKDNQKEPQFISPALQDQDEKDILQRFSPQQQEEIQQKQRLLSTIAYFIGKDFEIPVELNNPGEGWHWDFENNIVRIDTKDLLEEPMDYLRFLISHEAGHRRISRMDTIPIEQWQQPGFAFLNNAIEDPRDNNFIAESYPKFREQMGTAYKRDLDLATESRQRADQTLGYQPRYMQAGFEYVKQWFREIQGEEFELTADLPTEVKEVVQTTLESASDSWWRYPSRDEADNGVVISGQKFDKESIIRKYAESSYIINRDYIWPQFKKLVDADIKDQEIQEFLKDHQRSGEGGEEAESFNLPQELKDQLSPEEEIILQESMQQTMEGIKQEGSSSKKPIDLNSLPEQLKQKIRKFLETLPKELQEELTQKAKDTLKEFDATLNKEWESKLAENPERRSLRKEEKKEYPRDLNEKRNDLKEGEESKQEEMDRRRMKAESIFLNEEKDSYSIALDEVSNLIDQLSADMREIFTKRKLEKQESGYRSGRRLDVRQRIREKIANVPLFKTEAYEQKESESEEMDYAITLLVDLSGSMMENDKIKETFKSIVVLAETLNNLGINFEVVGFQDILLEFKTFGEQLDLPTRQKFNQLPLEVYGKNPNGHNNPGDNDDGACLLEASKRLERQDPKNKFLIVLSDGSPAMDSGKKNKSQLDRELRETINEISINTKQSLIGLGLNSQEVSKYYENHIAGITTEEMVETIGGLIREIINKY